MVEDIYAESQITPDEAVLTVLEAADEAMVGRRFAFGQSISIGRGQIMILSFRMAMCPIIMQW